MIAQQSLECEAPASLWIQDKIQTAGRNTENGRKAKTRTVFFDLGYWIFLVGYWTFKLIGHYTVIRPENDPLNQDKKREL